MSDLALNSISFQSSPQTQQVQAPQPQPQPPQPPKSQSDHKPANPSTSSHGPAVVLSGAFSQGTDKKRDNSSPGSNPPPSSGSSTQASSQATGQHINHVI